MEREQIGTLAVAAKATHRLSMFISEMDDPMHGCREPAITGLASIGARIFEAEVDTVAVRDTHWLVHSGYHVNACDHHSGIYTSHELPPISSRICAMTT